MTVIQLTLWEIIDALSRQLPFTKEKIERTLSINLNEPIYYGKDASRFFTSENLGLKNNVVVSKIDFRTKPDGAGPGFLVLNFEGACIGIAEIRHHYKTLEITASPRGNSLDEATNFSTIQHWGELSFGFKERRPECLAYVVLNPLSR